MTFIGDIAFKCEATGKRQYLDREHALLGGRMVRALDSARRHHEFPPRAVYKCNDCSWWHLTRKTAGKPVEQLLDPTMKERDDGTARHGS